MKHLILSASMVVGLAGCGSLPANLQSSGPGVDVARMDTINREATRRGVLVVWINPPRSKPAPASGS